jgi:hypothetical protein
MPEVWLWVSPPWGTEVGLLIKILSMHNDQKLKLKLGRKAKYLHRCILVNELLQRHEHCTSVRVRVFSLYIKPVVRCSYATFNNMLNEPNPHLQLEKIEKQLKGIT